jgi:hypothetical protein
MSDDNGAAMLIFVLMLSIPVMPVMYVFGIERGKDIGKDEGIVFCMEQPQKCKISYDYLKLQENQK